MAGATAESPGQAPEKVSDYRAQANHRLYLARILIAAWEQARASQQTPANTLAQAFEPAICDHLADAYGWFLLEITRPEPAPAVPPRGCSGLPAQAPGTVPAGEIREFQQLESDGWLAELLRERRGVVARKPGYQGQKPMQNLAQPAAVEPSTLTRWSDELQSLFDRMSDSLEEY